MIVGAFTCLLTFIGIAIGSVERLGGRFGSFKTSNYPEPYENDLKKEWQIEVRDGYRIKIQFTDFDLEDSYEEEKGPCVYDYVKIDEGNETLARFCGSSSSHSMDAPRAKQWIYTDKNKTTVFFVSDYSNEGISPRGFSAHFVEEDIDECEQLKIKAATTFEDWDQLVTCNHFCHNVPGSYYCSCRSGFKLHGNKHTCVASFCENVLLTGDKGEITSPDYPQPYAKLTDCNWNIEVRAGLSILMTFAKEFEIEKHDTEDCVYDILKVMYNGKTDTYCGNSTPGNGKMMDMNTREVKLQFHTDLSLEKKGFKIAYTTFRIRCLEKLKAPGKGRIITDLSKGYHEFEDVVEFKCNKGYHLIGSPKLKCQNDGTWDHATPTCKIKSCGAPEALLSIPNSEIINYRNTKATYGEVIRLKCNKWYEMVSGVDKWSCEDNEKWQAHNKPNSPRNLPQCRPACGIKGKDDRSIIRTLISGGTKTHPHEWPWMVFLNFGSKSLNAGHAICAGSLISPRFVLTAAHCLVNGGNAKDPNAVHVWLGVHNRLKNTSNVKYVKALRIIVHHNYDKASMWDQDVGLIELSETIIMGETIRPVCLPTTEAHYNLVAPNVTGEVAGWGLVDTFSAAPNILFQAKFPILDNERCWENFKAAAVSTGKPLPARLELTESMFCAGFNSGRQSTCQGDSGSPFVIAEPKSKKYFEVGLVSFGVGECGKRVTNSGYTRLTVKITKWIMEETENLK